MEFIEVIANTLGIPLNVIEALILCFTACFVSALAFILTNSFVISILLGNGVLVFGIIVGWLPVWIFVIVSLLGFATLVAPRFLETGDSKDNIPMEFIDEEEREEEQEEIKSEEAKTGTDPEQQLW